MCLIAFAVEPDSLHRLVLVANRDESYARSTAPAAEWEDIPGILGGRDLHAGGTWLGVTRTGRFAALTNFHEAVPPRVDAPSRGHLVTAFLTAEAAPGRFLKRLHLAADRFNGFNLVVGDASGTFWYSNRGNGGPAELEPGVYGLSNHLLDTPWPKVEAARQGLAGLLARTVPPDPSELLDLLNDRRLHDPPAGAEPLSPLERAFSAAFIVTPEYGTRSSTALILTGRGRGVLVERTYHRGSAEGREVRLEV